MSNVSFPINFVFFRFSRIDIGRKVLSFEIFGALIIPSVRERLLLEGFDEVGLTMLQNLVGGGRCFWALFLKIGFVNRMGCVLAVGSGEGICKV